MLDVRVVRQYQKNYPQLLKSINKLFLYEAGVHMQSQVQREINAMHIVDSGRYINSVKNKVSLSKDNVSIGTNVEYAPYLEYGTYKMPSRPAFRTALDNNKRELLGRWRSLFRKTFRTMGLL